MPISIRVACPEDAEAAAWLLRRSIELLCAKDHRDDNATLSEWTRNKRPETVCAWIEKPTNRSAVATEAGQIVGFAMFNEKGHVLLLYVLPEAARRGVGSMLLAWIEREASELGLRELKLESTLTAIPFYERHGFSRTGDARPGFGITRCHPMEKRLLA